jgi:hypothetical protein
MSVIDQLEPNLAVPLQEMQIFTNTTFAFVVVNPALDTAVLQYLSAVLNLALGKVEQKELVESVKSHIRDNSKVKYIVQQDYQARYQRPVPARYLEKTLATQDVGRAIKQNSTKCPGFTSYDLYLYAPCPVGTMFHQCYLMEVHKIKYAMDSRMSRITQASKCGYCSLCNHAKTNWFIWQQHNWSNTAEIEQQQHKAIFDTKTAKATAKAVANPTQGSNQRGCRTSHSRGSHGS